MYTLILQLQLEKFQLHLNHEVGEKIDIYFLLYNATPQAVLSNCTKLPSQMEGGNLQSFIVK